MIFVNRIKTHYLGSMEGQAGYRIVVPGAQAFMLADLLEMILIQRNNVARLNHRDCQKAAKEAHSEVVKAHNSWPSRYQRDHAIQMKEKVKAILMKDTLGEELKEYIDLDYPELFEDACFGQFLFKNRHQLKPEDCALIVKCCTMIQDLNQYVDPDGSARRRAQAAFGRQLDAEEKAIVKRLQAWVELA